MTVRTLTALVLVLAPGCDTISGLLGGDDEAGGQTAAPVVAPAPAPAAQAAAPKPEGPPAEEMFVYNPIGKRDPFRTFLTKENEDENGPARTDLQKYDIDQYKLVGIVWGNERPRALVQDPTGEGFVMEIGTYIGKNWGKVTQIQSDVVVVTEEYEAMDGRLIVNPIHLKLPQVQEVEQ
jgi:type IV pilus assembly protein PilP